MVYRILILLIVLGQLAIAAPSAAFDGERPGLILGGGVGVSTSFITQDLDGTRYADLTQVGVALDVRAGWGVNESILLFATARGSWIRYDTQNRSDTDVLHGVVTGGWRDGGINRQRRRKTDLRWRVVLVFLAIV